MIAQGEQLLPIVREDTHARENGCRTPADRQRAVEMRAR